MRQRTAKWFEIKVAYERMGDNGLNTKVKEMYVVDALSFSEAEEQIMEEMSAFITGAFDILTITPATYKEIFFSENANDDRWYKAKLQFVTIDEKTEKEKRTNVYYLVQGATTQGAMKTIEACMEGSVFDYIIASVAETKIMDVFEHNYNATAAEKNDKPEYEQ